MLASIITVQYESMKERFLDSDYSTLDGSIYIRNFVQDVNEKR